MFIEGEFYTIPMFPMQDNGNIQRMGSFQASPVGWHGPQGIPTTPIVKRVIRLDVPVDKYPNVSPNRVFSLRIMSVYLLNVICFFF